MVSIEGHSLKKIIKEKNNFTKIDKIIIDFLDNNQNEIAFYSIQRLAQELGIAQASIQRFVKKIGYDGFASFKKAIIEELKNNIAPLEKYKLRLIKKFDDNLTINQIAQNEVDNINSTINQVDKKQISNSVKHIIAAENILIAGVNLSSFLSGLTAYLFQRIGLKAFNLNQSGVSFVEQIINISEKDVFIAFSFPPYSSQTIDAAKFAQLHKAKIISFTDSITSPILEYSHAHLLIKTVSTNFSNSLSPIIVMIYSLISEIAVKDKRRSLEALDKIISAR